MGRLAVLTRNELAIILRDPSAMFWIFLFPLFFLFMMLFAFGSAGALPQQTIEIVDLDHSAMSRRYVDEIRKSFSGNESLPGQLRDAREGDPVARGASRITLPEGFGSSLEHRYPATATVTYAEDGLAAQLVVRVLRAVSLKFNADISDAPDLVSVRGDARGAAPSVRFAHYALTGTMVMSMMSAGMMSLCVALAYRRERNGFKMLACMPLRASSFLLGMLLSRLVLLLLAAFALVLVAQHLFGVPLVLTITRLLKGIPVMIVGGATMLALGCLLGARIGTTSAANFVTGLVYIALLFLCDLTMPITAMPPGVRDVVAHLPPALFVETLRQGFILDDALRPQLQPLLELGGWLAGFSLIAVLTFRWHRQ